MTTYRLVRHSISRELWALRFEADVLTGAHGPVVADSVGPLADLVYDEHPDDLYWILRAWESFEVVQQAE